MWLCAGVSACERVCVDAGVRTAACDTRQIMHVFPETIRSLAPLLLWRSGEVQVLKLPLYTLYSTGRVKYYKHIHTVYTVFNIQVQLDGVRYDIIYGELYGFTF